MVADGTGEFGGHLDLSAHQSSHTKDYKKAKCDLDDTIKDLDVKLNRVLAKQEYEYFKGYNIYVKRKEKDLRDLILKLSEKHSTYNSKDEKLMNMEKTLESIKQDRINQENTNIELRKKVKELKKQLNESLTDGT